MTGLISPLRVDWQGSKDGCIVAMATYSFLYIAHWFKTVVKLLTTIFLMFGRHLPANKKKRTCSLSLSSKNKRKRNCGTRCSNFPLFWALLTWQEKSPLNVHLLACYKDCMLLTVELDLWHMTSCGCANDGSGFHFPGNTFFMYLQYTAMHIWWWWTVVTSPAFNSLHEF